MLGLHRRSFRNVISTFRRGHATTTPLQGRKTSRQPDATDLAQESAKHVQELRALQKKAAIEKATAATTSNTKRKPYEAKWARYGAFVSAGIIGYYTVQIVLALSRASKEDVVELSDQKDVAGRYDEIADRFDSDVGVSEQLMFITSTRKSLSKMCTGNVLEVSCGTGRNLGYFDLDSKVRKIKSLTLIDLSPQMVQVCKRKFMTLRRMVKMDNTNKINDTTIRFVAGSALDDMPLAPDGAKYDTILQTMGLCSTTTPTELIVNMARHLNLDNPDARILLLEHGRSHYGWLNKVLDNTATKHADVYGCWFNRPLDEIVQAAAQQAGLEVVRSRRRHLGTTFIYELKAGPHAAKLLETTSPRSEGSDGTSWTKWISKTIARLS